MRNNHSATCIVCRTYVPAGAGFIQRMEGRWVYQCQSCAGKGNEPAPSPSTPGKAERVGWMKIETAPKDGSAVDLWVVSKNDDLGFRYPDACYDLVGVDDMGWTDCNHHGSLEPDVRPTHWMPIQKEPGNGE